VGEGGGEEEVTEGAVDKLHAPVVDTVSKTLALVASSRDSSKYKR
jgi:hypothetical protein